MSVMHEYTVEVSDDSDLPVIKQALDEVGLGITREWDTGCVGADSNAPDEVLPSADKKSVKLDAVKRKLQDYTGVIEKLEYEMREDTGGNIKQIEFSTQDGEFVEESSNSVTLG